MKILYVDFISDILMAVMDGEISAANAIIEASKYVPFDDVGYTKDELLNNIFQICLTYGQDKALCSTICNGISKTIGCDYSFTETFDVLFGKPIGEELYLFFIDNNTDFDKVLNHKIPITVKMAFLTSVLNILVVRKGIRQKDVDVIRKYIEIKRHFNRKVEAQNESNN